jgi:hypothetical protein
MAEPYRPAPDISFPETTSDKNLRVLAVFHYVVGVLVMLFSSLFIIHVVIGIGMMRSHGGPAWPMPAAPGPHAEAPPPWFGAIFVAMGAAAVVLGWTMGLLTFLAGYSIAQRRRHLFCLVIAGLLCMWVPFGTLLGVFTLVLLTKPHVRAQFEASAGEARRKEGKQMSEA